MPGFIHLPEQGNRVTVLLTLIAVALAGLILLRPSQSAHGQPTCDNPFTGQQVAFETGFWRLTDFCRHSVPYGEIRPGGPPPDGIPPIDDPLFESVREAAEWLQPQSPLLSVEINGDARAYPLSIMVWHEVANDVVGGLPVVVTYCPLCNSGIIFDRRVNGQALRFGVSGNLRHSDLIMWDDRTQSWWQQFTGEGIVGAHTGTQLQFIPSQMVSFGAFMEQFPDGVVLSRNTGFNREYGRTPYAGYESAASTALFVDQIDDRIPAAERVLAGVIGGQPMAYPFSILEARSVINDTVGGRDIVAFWQPGATAALDGVAIDLSRDIGMAALYSRDIGGRVLTFKIGSDGLIRDDQTGSVWNMFGSATAGPLAGSQLRQQLAAPHFWFAWKAFQENTRLFGFD